MFASLRWSGGAYIGRGNDEFYFALDEGKFEADWDFIEGSSGEWGRPDCHWDFGTPRDDYFLLRFLIVINYA